MSAPTTPPEKNKGIFVVFEGIDKSGKSTQCRLLHEAMRVKNIPSVLMSFPNRETDIGYLIDKCLRGEVTMDEKAMRLLFSANRWEMKDAILQYLEDGVMVICDRYIYSGVAYGFKEGVADRRWLESLDEGLPRPDVVFYLNVGVDDIKARSGFGDELYEKESLQFQAKRMFDIILIDRCMVHKLDGTLSVEELSQQIEYQIDIIMDVYAGGCTILQFEPTRA